MFPKNLQAGGNYKYSDLLKKSKTLKKDVRNVMWGFYSRMHEFKKQYTFEQYIGFCITGQIFCT